MSLVRPMFKYASVVWSPHHANKIDRIERIQRAFLRAWCYKSRIEFSKERYAELCRLSGVLPLHARREVSDILLTDKLGPELRFRYLIYFKLKTFQVFIYLLGQK